MPHKDAAARIAGHRSPGVRRLGAANTLSFAEGTIFAESTDGDGLLDDLRQGAQFDPAGRRCGVIGAGGAGRAAVLALAEAGAAEVVIVNRTPTAAWRSAAVAPKVARVGRPEELSGMDLVIQATPIALAGVSPPADHRSATVAGVDPARLGGGQLIIDLVYDPPLTPFLLEAQRHGARVRNGLGMLVHQAARQIRLWTGSEPPLSVMWGVVGGDVARGPGAPAS
jgi:shikimate dehydrogenase